jgi:hypothetical protein
MVMEGGVQRGHAGGLVRSRIMGENRLIRFLVGNGLDGDTGDDCRGDNYGLSSVVPRDLVRIELAGVQVPDKTRHVFQAGVSTGSDMHGRSRASSAVRALSWTRDLDPFFAATESMF